MSTPQILAGFAASALLGVFYGLVVAAAYAVWRYAGLTRELGQSRTGADHCPGLRLWALLLVATTTVVIWVWPFSYAAYVWRLYHAGRLLATADLGGLAGRPAAAVATVLFGIWLYVSRRARRRRRR